MFDNQKLEYLVGTFLFGYILNVVSQIIIFFVFIQGDINRKIV